MNKITRKRQNDAFAFFTLQRGAAQGKVNLRGVYKREPLKCRAKRKTPRLAEGRPAGLSYPHGVPQAAACRGTRELKSPKEAKRRFCLFSLISIRMEVNAARIKNGVPRKARRRGKLRTESALSADSALWLGFSSNHGNSQPPSRREVRESLYLHPPHVLQLPLQWAGLVPVAENIFPLQARSAFALQAGQ